MLSITETACRPSHYAARTLSLPSYGADMPNSIDGNWNFNEALAPLVDAGHRDNTIIVRGLHNGIPGIDPHWQNSLGVEQWIGNFQS